MKKNAFFVAELVSVIVLIASAVVYAMADARENSPLIIGLLAVAAVVGVVLLVKHFPSGEYIPFVLSLISVVVFIPLAFDEIGDVLSKINMNGLSASWIASAVLIVLSMVCTGVSTTVAAKD